MRPPPAIDVGAHLRAIRQARGYSQRELAKRAGVTNGMISLIEQNRVSPSVSSLKKVLDGIPMSLADFFVADPAPAPVFFGADELVEVGSGGLGARLVAAGRAGRALSLVRQRYAPGADTGEALLARPGETAGIVLAGSIEVTVGSERRVLGPGDAYYFATTVPHRFRTAGSGDCEIISSSCPAVP
jgi:transcriptional regulator with XRE-family HTH domain